MVGHKEGVWCINYHQSGTQLITASPEGIAKIWDQKSGKSTADLKFHTKRVILPLILMIRYSGQLIIMQVLLLQLVEVIGY